MEKRKKTASVPTTCEDNLQKSMAICANLSRLRKYYAFKIFTFKKTATKTTLTSEFLPANLETDASADVATFQQQQQPHQVNIVNQTMQSNNFVTIQNITATTTTPTSESQSANLKTDASADVATFQPPQQPQQVNIVNQTMQSNNFVTIQNKTATTTILFSFFQFCGKRDDGAWKTSKKNQLETKKRKIISES